jgi:hypothetical protein
MSKKDLYLNVRKLVKEMTGDDGEIISKQGGRHPKIRCTILGTSQDFPLPSKELNAGSSEKNYYSQMRRKITERIEQVQNRQQLQQ